MSFRSHSGAKNKVIEYVDLRVLPKSSKVVSGKTQSPIGWISDTFLSKIPIAPCYCQMMGRTLKEEIRITQYNNPTKAGKYSLEDLFRASDNIPHHYPKF